MTAPTRALRSNTTLPANAPPALPPAIMAPASKSKKRKASALVEKFTCSSCAEDKPSRLFPDYNPSPECEHLINTCKSCLRKWVEGCIEGGVFRGAAVAREEGGEGGGGESGEKKKKKKKEKGEVWGVGCPECEAVMRAVNVQMAVPKRVFHR